MANFELTRTGILRSAYQLAGVVMAGSDPNSPQLTMGSDFLNLVLQDMQNHGIMLRKLEQTTIPLVYGQAQYTLADDTLDVDIATPYVTSNDSVNLPMDTISRGMYMSLTNANPLNPTISQPTQIYTERSLVMSVFLYPAPDANWVSFTIPRVVLLSNMDSAADVTGLQAKYLKTIVFGVAHMLAFGNGLLQKAKMFGDQFESLLKTSTGDDAEKGNTQFVADYGNGQGWG